MEPIITELETFFKALADRTRLQIVLFLMDKGEATVMEISENIGKSQSLVSHHLSCLRNCGVVKVNKKGKNSLYSISTEEVREILKTALKHVEKYSQSILACDIIKKENSVSLQQGL
jgi:DNA-binding transcriptional ArsR family regulator